MAQRKTIRGLSRHGFKMKRDGKWVQFIGNNGKVCFQVSRDCLFDGEGNYFREAIDGF